MTSDHFHLSHSLNSQNQLYSSYQRSLWIAENNFLILLEFHLSNFDIPNPLNFSELPFLKELEPYLDEGLIILGCA